MKSILNSYKSFIPWLISLVLLGVCLWLYAHPKTVEIEKEVPTEVIKEVVVTKVETVGVVEHKKQATDPDVVYNTKDSLKVSINGKTVDLKPKDSEKFEYGKDYIKLNQESTYSISINNKPLEPTFSMGIGYTNNKKLAGLTSVRLKKTPFQVWGMSDGKTHAVGIMCSMNYK